MPPPPPPRSVPPVRQAAGGAPRGCAQPGGEGCSGGALSDVPAPRRPLLPAPRTHYGQTMTVTTFLRHHPSFVARPRGHAGWWL